MIRLGRQASRQLGSQAGSMQAGIAKILTLRNNFVSIIKFKNIEQNA